MKTTCYLILKAERFRKTSPIRGVKVVAVRAGRPSLATDEAAIKVVLDVPESLFDAAEVGLVVEPRHAALAVEQDPFEGAVEEAVA